MVVEKGYFPFHQIESQGSCNIWSNFVLYCGIIFKIGVFSSETAYIAYEVIKN